MTVGTREQFQQGMGQGNMLASNLLVQNSLRRKHFYQFQNEMIRITREVLDAYADLRARVTPTRIASIGVQEVRWEVSDEFTPGNVGMDPVVRGEESRMDYDEDASPIPYFYKEWSLTERHLAASELLGGYIRADSLREATRVVLESMDDSLVNGIPNFEFNGKQIYGYLNQPFRKTYTIPKTWDFTKGDHATPEQIVADVRKMVNELFRWEHRAPFVLYVPRNWWMSLSLPYNYQGAAYQGADQSVVATTGQNILQAIQALPGIGSVRPLLKLPENHLVLGSINNSTMGMPIIRDLRNVIYQQQPSVTQFRVYYVGSHYFKVDKRKNSAFIHASV